MSYLKRFVIVLSIFFVLAFLLSMFFPSTVQLEKTVVINHDIALVNEKFAELNIKRLLSYNLDEKVIWNTIETDNGIEVKVNLNLAYGFNPAAKFSGLFNKEALNAAFVSKIDSVKAYIENLPKIHSVKVEKRFVAETIWFLSIRDTVNQREMSNIHGKLYAKINQYMDANAVESDAAPLIIYHLWTDSIVDVEAGIPIKDSLMVSDSHIRLNKMLPGNVVTATHYGSYERLPETYFGINEWMRKNRVIVVSPPWESYVTDPAKEENPDKWETVIFFPVE